MLSGMHENGKKFRLGLALSGGGARGFAHAGALAALEEAGHKPDVIAGVSAGSVVAVLYAAGMSPKDLLELFTSAKAKNFVDFNIHGGGFFHINPFRKFIEANLGGIRNLEDLKIPTFIGVTDFDNGVATEFHSGDIGQRVMASCSIPIAFKPVTIDGTTYVDGGVLRNHPAWIIRDKCEYLIGVNVSPLEGKNKGKNNSLLSVALRTYNLMAKANQKEDMNLCDINVETREIAHYPTFDLRSIEKVYLSGYSNMRRALRIAGIWKQPLDSLTTNLPPAE